MRENPHMGAGVAEPESGALSGLYKQLHDYSNNAQLYDP